MTHEKKIDYMRIACGIVGYAFKENHLDAIVSLYEVVLEKKGKATVDDFVDVQFEVKKRADIKSKQDMLDKVSDKVE